MSIKEKLSRLDSLEAGLFLGLLLPVGLLLVTLRIVRSVARQLLTGFGASVSLLTPDLAIATAFVALVLAGIWRLRGKARVAFAVAAQVVAVVWVSLELVAFNFFMVTGSIFDAQLLGYAIKRSGETFELVNSSTPWFIKLGMILSAIVALAAPWLIRFFWARKLQDPEHTPARSPRKAMLVGVGALLLSLLLPLAHWGVPATLSRNAMVTLVASLSSAQEKGGDALASGFDTREATLLPIPGAPRRNVVIIMLESTRASATTMHNPELKTTPFMDELSRESFFAQRAYAVMPHTSKALVSVLCGIPPHLTLRISEAEPIGMPGRCLAELFKEVGYATSYFQTATERFESRPGMIRNMGYEDFFPSEKLGSTKGFEKANYFGVEDNIMLEPSRAWIKQLPRDKPFLMTYLTVTPHHGYIAPRRYGRKTYDERDEFNRYLNSVNYVDHFVKNVVDLFKEEGLYEDTIFVIVGDHGEGFGEHKRSQHDNVIYEEGLHVPLIVHDPLRVKDAKAIPYLITQLDIAPTVINLSGHSVLDGSFPGEDISTLSHQRRLYAHCWYEKRCMATIKGDEKFIDHFGTQPDEFFDLSSDPLERKNLLPGRDVSQERASLRRWRENVNAFYDAHRSALTERYILDERPEQEPPIKLDIKLGDALHIYGAKIVEQGPFKPGVTITVELYMQILEPPGEGWRFFMHGIDEKARTTNHDHTFVSGTYPAEKWEQGKFVIDRHTLNVSNRARKSYELRAGLWHKEKGRMPVGGAQSPKDMRAVITRLQVEP